ncbi:MAG: hypothetical protein ACOYJH_00060 [Anaerovoracaceae bacterium]
MYAPEAGPRTETGSDLTPDLSFVENLVAGTGFFALLHAKFSTFIEGQDLEKADRRRKNHPRARDRWKFCVQYRDIPVGRHKIYRTEGKSAHDISP